MAARGALRDHALEPPRFAPSDVAVWCSGALLAAPVLALRYPPMGDLPFHESLVALLRHFGDPAWSPPGLYRLNLGQPNQAFHLVAWALSLVAPTDVACKLTIAAAVGGTPPSAARLARHFDRSAWSALLSAPLALGFAFRWGLVGNVIGLPLLLLALPVLDRFAGAPTLRRAAQSAAVVAGLFFVHESAMVVAVIACACFALRVPEPEPESGRRRPRGAARAALLLLPVAAGVALAAVYAARSPRLKAPSILAVADRFGDGPLRRLLDVPGVLFGPIDRAALWATFVLYAAGLVALGLERLRFAPRAAPGVFARTAGARLALLALACGACFFAFPLAHGGSTLLYQRFLPPALAVLAVALAPPAAAGVRRRATWLCAVPCLAVLAVSLPAFLDADRRYQELDQVLPLVEEDSAVAALDLTPRPPSAVAPVPGAAARALAERGGRLLFSFTDAPTSPVVMRADLQWNEPVLRLAGDPMAFCPSDDMRRFRYVLVRLAGPPSGALQRRVAAAFAPDARPLAASGEWLLFESTRDVLPVDAPGEGMTAPTGSTLRARLAAPARHDPGAH